MPHCSKRFTPDRLPDYSKSEIIKEIRRVILDECGGIAPSRDRFERLARVTHPTIAKRFGTYREAIRQAGFTVHRQMSRPIITAEQVKANLFKVLERANGHYFSQDFYRKNGGAYSEEVVKARLGVRNWQGAMEAIGAKKKQRIVHTVVSSHAQRRNFLAKVTETDLFEEIDRVWQEKGARPTYSEFRKASSLGVGVYETRFGSWTKAVAAFCRKKGMEVSLRLRRRWRTRPTKDILLDELRAIQLKRPGIVLTYEIYKANGGTYSRSVFIRHFDSWTSAVNAVGGVSGRQAKYSRDELFDEIQRLWEQFGRQPTQVQMWKQGKISPKCYARMFGSWTKAIHAFCGDRNDDPARTASSETPGCNRDIIEPVRSEWPVNIPSKNVAARVIEHRTGRKVPLKMRFLVFKRDNFTCKACGRSPANHPGLELHPDHVVAWTGGGETELANLQTLCKECNLGKSDL